MWWCSFGNQEEGQGVGGGNEIGVGQIYLEVYYALNCVPLKRYVDILTARPSDYDLIWK